MNESMPKAVATVILLSGHSKTNRFRKVCNTARERVCEPVSRSTRLNISAPATPMQKFERRLRKANAKQLTTWLRRRQRRGNRLRDLYDEIDYRDPSKWDTTITMIEQSIAESDGIAQAINSELDNRSKRGKVLHV